MILRHEGRRPLPPPTYAGEVCWKVKAISGARYPDAVLIMIFHGHSWLLIMFLPGGRAKSFPRPTFGLEEPSRFREPLHNKIQLARTKR